MMADSDWCVDAGDHVGGMGDGACADDDTGWQSQRNWHMRAAATLPYAVQPG